MKSGSPLRQFFTLFQFLLKSELVNKERLLAPVMFSGITIILISFGVGDLPQDINLEFYNTKLFVTLVLALSLFFGRVFDLDRKDGIHELMRTYSLNSFSWFAAKFCLVFLVAWSTCIPTFIFAKLFSGISGDLFAHFLQTLAILSATLAGLTSVGVLLSAVIMNADSRALLFPVLFFPLAVPVLLAALNCNDRILMGNWKGASDGWFQLLLIFDITYFTLGSVLYAETVEN
jgi:heme exporter protein B